jgi:hypothetical protein
MELDPLFETHRPDVAGGVGTELLREHKLQVELGVPVGERLVQLEQPGEVGKINAAVGSSVSPAPPP